MKTLAILLTMALMMAVAKAQDVQGPTQSAATTAASPYEAVGIVVAYNATKQSLAVATPGSTAPISYIMTSATVLVDAANNSITGDLLQKGVPVTVLYAPGQADMVATKVIVRKELPSKQAH